MVGFFLAPQALGHQSGCSRNGNECDQGVAKSGYGRGLGSAAWSQPAREFIVKIVEMSLFAADFLCGHFLLFFLTVPCLIPGIDILHSTMLCAFLFVHYRERVANASRLAVWLRPSKQIRSPIFSFKQRALRRTIIFKVRSVLGNDELALTTRAVWNPVRQRVRVLPGPHHRPVCSLISIKLCTH